MKIKKLLSCIILISLAVLAGCQGSDTSTKTVKTDSNAKAKLATFTIKDTKSTTSLFFNGIISPIHIFSVVSPVNGIVQQVYFNYGQKVNKGQLLLGLESTELDKNYQSVVSAFLTAKEKYNTNKNNIVGDKNLFDAGITSKQTYETAISSLNDAYLGYLQAEHNLIQVLKKAGIRRDKIALLKIGDAEAVRKALQLPIRGVEIRAKGTGVALLPTQAAAGQGASGGDAKIKIGSNIKLGQLVLTIGNMSGIKIKVNVGEIDINRIKKGDQAVIKSPAFPGITLKGVVSEVSKQANSQEGSGLPSFPITIKVAMITNAQREVIHVGMSAKVEIKVSTGEKIIVPLTAVKTDKGQAYVMLINLKTKKPEKHTVETGSTTVKGVAITNGLKVGDKIVLNPR